MGVVEDRREVGEEMCDDVDGFGAVVLVAVAMTVAENHCVRTVGLSQCVVKHNVVQDVHGVQELLEGGGGCVLLGVEEVEEETGHRHSGVGPADDPRSELFDVLFGARVTRQQ